MFDNIIFFQGFVQVSTAYSHCPRSEIKEYFYPVSISTKELKDLVKLGENTQTYINIFRFFITQLFSVFNYYILWKNSFEADWLNTYTFTKTLTENVILTNENQLPISIFCPSISKNLKYANI